MARPSRLHAMLWFCRATVWTAALLVPASTRRAWRSEHDRRFWHWCHFLAESRQLDAHNRLLISRACWKLYPEAFWQRFDRDSFIASARQVLGSPTALLVAIAAVTLALAFGFGAVSAVRSALQAPVPEPSNAVTITLSSNSLNGNYSRTTSITMLDLVGIWKKSRLAAGVVPFSWSPGHLLSPKRDLAVLTTRVGPEFFTTLGVTPQLGRVFAPADVDACTTCVLLSNGLWRSVFHSDAEIVGKQIVLNGAPRTVIGVLPPSFRMIAPGNTVWTLIDPYSLFTNFQRRVGAVARLRPGATTESLQRELTDLTESGGYVHPASQIQVVSVATQQRRNLTGLLWFALLATGCALLAVILRNASRGIGHWPEGAGRRVLWIGFLASKSALLLVIAMIAAWRTVFWVSYWLDGPNNPAVPEYALWLFLPLATVALSWAFSDQRQRCPMCLKRLELPVEIGRTGSVLLNWAGTELVCPLGHGVLYLPESEANSLDQDRWNKLDDSWGGLFRP